MWKYRYYLIIGLVLLILLCSVIYRLLPIRHKPMARFFIYSILIEIVISPLRGYVSFMACMAVGFGIFILFTFYILNKYGQEISEWRILLILVLGICLINVERFFDFESTLISLPDELFHLFGIFVGFSLFKIKSKFKWAVLIITSILCLFMFFSGYDLWLNKLNYGTFTGELIEEKITQEIAFTDSTNSEININHLKGKIVLLDFWNSKCGICYSKFPVVQKAFNKYKHNSKVSFYSVNFFLKGRDKDSDAFRIIKERGYSFPVLICKEKALLTDLKITGFPTVLIVNKKGELVFRGDIVDVDKKIEELLKENN